MGKAGGVVYNGMLWKGSAREVSLLFAVCVEMRQAGMMPSGVHPAPSGPPPVTPPRRDAGVRGSYERILRA